MKKKQTVKVVDLKTIRQALADYMMSEGCSCCEGRNHDEHKAVLGKLLKVPMYSDKSGYNFSKFRTEEKGNLDEQRTT